MGHIGQMEKTLKDSIQEKPRQYAEIPFLKKSILIKFAAWGKGKDWKTLRYIKWLWKLSSWFG